MSALRSSSGNEFSTRFWKHDLKSRRTTLSQKRRCGCSRLCSATCAQDFQGHARSKHDKWCAIQSARRSRVSSSMRAICANIAPTTLAIILGNVGIAAHKSWITTW
jgi:hypothetical protein